MGMAAPLFYTKEMVQALPYDGERYETVHGELLVTPSPRLIHQRVLRRLTGVLSGYVEAERVGEVLFAPADISWGPDILVQPDLFVAALAETRTDDWSRVRTLLLVIEILSPSTARQDRFTKRRLYQEVGTPTAWFVDCDARHVEVWTPDATFPVFESERVRWEPDGATCPLLLDIPPLFHPV
jgi:Uma2 family endonuclease